VKELNPGNQKATEGLRRIMMNSDSQSEKLEIKDKILKSADKAKEEGVAFFKAGNTIFFINNMNFREI